MILRLPLIGSWTLECSRAVRKPYGLVCSVDRCRRDEIGASIARGYRERPQGESEVGWADESSVRMIAEEPW